jgi:hypothetical protein
MRKIKFTLLMLIAFIGFSFNANSQCNYTISLYDSYGDGWNGGAVTVFVNGTAVHTGLTLATGGGPVVYNIPVSTGDDITTDYTAGSWSGENRYTISDVTGTVINEQGAGTTTPGDIVTGTITASCPACPPPSDLAAGSITNVGAILSWTAGGSEISWNIEYGTSGFTLGTGTAVAGVANPYSISGLSAATSYSYYVQADCGGDQSTWVGPYTFTTSACAPVDQCTYSITMDDTYGDGWNGASVEIIQNGLSLGLFSSTAAYQTATVNICDATTIELVWIAGTYPGECSFSLTDPFGTVVYSFVAGGNPAVGTFHTFTSSCTPPACLAPTNLTSSSSDGISYDLGWTESGSATTWNIEWGNNGFTLGSGTLISGVTDNPHTITGLTPGTAYSFYVQADCAGTTSTWAGPFSFIYLPGDNCSNAQDLAGLTSPYAATTTGYTNDFSFCTMGTSADRIFYIDVPNGYQISINQVSNLYDSRHTMRYGNACPGDNEIACIDDPDTDPISWINTTGSTERVYWINAGYGSGSGDFVLAWTLAPLSTETDILTYTFPEATGAATIDATAHTVAIEVGNGTDRTALVASFTLSTGADAAIAGTPQVSGTTANNFTNPVTYTVTAEDGTTTQDWVVTVTEASVNTETDILTYSFPQETGTATIDPTGHTVAIEVNWEANVTNLVAGFTLSYGANAVVAGTPQVSTTTANDFTNPVTYTITAEDGTTTQDWIVTVTKQATPQGALCANPIPLTLPASGITGATDGMGDNYDNTMACGSSYMTGDDIVYQFTLAQDGTISGSMTSPDTWIGMFILDGCPDDVATSCIVTSTATGSSTSFTDQPITAGTYYLVISSWPAPQSIDFTFNLTFTPPVVPTLTWDATTFTEALANDGSISTVVNLSLTNETFATTGDLTAATHYNVANVPAGLTVVINASDANTATVSLTGNAAAHENANDVSNMEITFLDAAFTGGVAADVTGYTQTALVVDFEDAAAVAALIINEIDADQTGTDGNEFIELFDGGFGNTSLTGYVVVLYNGATDDSYDAIDLTGYSTDADGYFVIGSATVPNVDLVHFTTNGIQNGQDAVALFNDVIGNFPTGTAITTTNLVDALVYGTADPDDAELQVLLNPGQTQFSEGTGATAPFYSCSRIPNGAGGARNTDTYQQGIPSPGASNQAIPVLTWDATTFVEAVANDGSISTVVNLSLASDEFTTTGDLTEVTHYNVANVPVGLTVVINVADATNATVTLTGNAAAHANANDIANMGITFLDAAFTAVTANFIVGSSQTALVVDFNDPDPAQLTWSTTTFVEAAANDGSIETVVNLTLTEETFATIGTLGVTDYSFANVPTGLTLEITTTSATEATVVLTGNATAHENIDDIANMEIAFYDAAFTGGVAADVIGYSQTALAVDFNDAVVLTTDLTIVFPEAENYVCDFDGTDTIPIAIMNIGETTIASGSTINIFYQFDGGPVVSDVIVLATDLAPTEMVVDMFDAEEDLSAAGTYNWTMWLEFADDDVAANNTITGIVVSYDVEVDLGGIDDTITVVSYPTTLDAGTHPYTATYLWWDMSTNQTLIVNADGWYGVIVEDENGCWDEDSVYVQLMDGVNNVETSTVFNVYPNPNKGIFTYEINTSASENMVIELTNVHGQVVYSHEENAVSVLTEEIDIRSFADGVYFLKVRTQTQNLVKKIVVQ